VAIEIGLPDIGDFSDVPVIEVHVSPGDTVAADDPLVTLESDKATMDVPMPQAGTVAEVRVNVGDRVSQGTVLLTIEPAGGAAAGGAAASGAAARSGSTSPAAPAPASRPGTAPVCTSGSTSWCPTSATSRRYR